MLLTHQSLSSRGGAMGALAPLVRKAFVLVRAPDMIHTSTFRWFSALSGGCAICLLLTSIFIYWRTSNYVIAGVDRSVADLADTFSALSPPIRLEALRGYLNEDPHRTKLVGLFDASGNRIFGNIEKLPQSMRPDAPAQDLAVVRTDGLARDQQIIRAGARRLADGMMLIIGRNVEEVKQIGASVGRVLAVGLVSVLGLGLAGAAFVGVKLRRRMELVHQLAQQIEAGELTGRMPVTGTNDPFDQLAILFNRMFDRIESLIGGVAAVGDGIAHDLRTPLAHVRLILERGLEHATGLDQLRAVVDRGIDGLDRSLTIVTALLRIAEIEHSRRRAGFGNVRLRELVHEVGELYEPIAENKGVSLTLKADQEVVIWGDRDLLFEATANLVDNALKFTPQDGEVELKLCCAQQGVTLSVADSGPGIPPGERDYVTRRFYRSKESRGKPGLGLGLSLVAAVTQLHGFEFTISSGPGCLAQITIPREGPEPQAPALSF
jgi:signal transduction histidine kinase